MAMPRPAASNLVASLEYRMVGPRLIYCRCPWQMHTRGWVRGARQTYRGRAKEPPPPPPMQPERPPAASKDLVPSSPAPRAGDVEQAFDLLQRATSIAEGSTPEGALILLEPQAFLGAV